MLWNLAIGETEIMSKRIYIIYDHRAYIEDPDKCVIMCTANSMEEAKKDRDGSFPGCPIYSYNCNNKVLKDQRFEE